MKVLFWVIDPEPSSSPLVCVFFSSFVLPLTQTYLQALAICPTRFFP